MAELDYISRKARAAREFDCVAGPASFTLRVPTKLESSIAFAESLDGRKRRDSVTSLRFERALVLQSVVGWSGVTVGHVLPDYTQPAEPFEFEPGAAELLFDAKPEWEGAVLQALMQRIAQRQAAEDTAAKN